MAPRKNFKNLKKIRGVNRLIKEVQSEYSVLKTHNIFACLAKVNKITFFGVYSKMAEKRIFLIFVDSFLNFCKVNKNFDYSKFLQFFFYTGPHYMDFTLIPL